MTSVNHFRPRAAGDTCRRSGCAKTIHAPNADDWCPDCLRDAANYGADDYDACRDMANRRNAMAHAMTIGARA